MTATGGQRQVAAIVDAGEVVVQAGEQRSARIESLRAVAALAVLVSHVWLYHHRFFPSAFDSFGGRLLAGGGFGVQLFFALSGFLIFRPFARRDFGEGARIDLRTYVRNRAVRIVPLYVVAVAVLLIFTQDGGTLSQWWRFMLFAEGFSTATAQTVDPPLWSVVVEVHFYALLPLLAWALARVCRGRRWTAVGVLVAAAVPSVVFRRIDPDPISVWRFSLPATFYGFVPGMVLALLQIEWERRRPHRLQGLLARADAWLAASAVLWALCCWDYDWTVPLTAGAAFLTVGAVVLPLEHGPVVRLLDLRALALVGVASYSLYVWHVPIIERLYLRSALDSFPALLAVATPLALAAAAVSYMLVERPALSLRRRWADVASRSATASRGASSRVAALTARLTPDQQWLAMIGAVAFLARARMVMATRDLVLSADPADYDRLGRLLAAGQGFGESVLSPSGGPTAFRPPLYPLFLGAVYEVTDGSIVTARLVQAVLGAVAVVLIWLIARRLFGRTAAFVAAGVAAVYPPLVVASVALLSESIFIPLMLAAFVAALAARDGGPRSLHWALAAGALAGLGMLARPNSLAMLPALVVLVLAWSRSSWNHRAGLARAAAMLIALVAVLVPWQIRNATTFDDLVFIADIDGYNVAGVYNDDSASAGYPSRYQFRPPIGVAAFAPAFTDPAFDEVSLGEHLRSEGFDHIRDHPTAPVQALFWNSFRMLELPGLDQSAIIALEAGLGRTTAAAGMVSFWLLAAVALAAVGSTAVRRAPLSVWAAPALLWVGTALFLGNPRLRAPVEPFLVLAAAPVFAEVGTRIVARLRPRRATFMATDVAAGPARAS